MAKKEKVVDLKPEKITDEQLEKVQNTVNTINRAQLEIGSMEVKKHEILHQLAGIREQLSDLQKDFEKEYGTFDVDIQTGKINYPDNGEVNKKN
tara:strand:- start:124 stop:405 length:282 start_codon:yes stop_codon:yes gene_type:complete